MTRDGVLYNANFTDRVLVPALAAAREKLTERRADPPRASVLAGPDAGGYVPYPRSGRLDTVALLGAAARSSCACLSTAPTSSCWAAPKMNAYAKICS